MRRMFIGMLAAVLAVALCGCKKEASPKIEDVSTVTGSINGHDYVDLGLSVKWATCNVGAKKPSEFGGFYAWGETETKERYDRDNSVMYDNDDIDDIQGTEYDVAYVKWGKNWRMPTEDEFEELLDECEWKWITVNKITGFKVTGPNGNSIFLPAAGDYDWGDKHNYTGKSGSYWTGTRDWTGSAYYLQFTSSSFNYVGLSDVSSGYTVRPVTDK